MKFFKMLIFSITLCFLTVSNLFASETLNNEAVISMVKSGLGIELIVSKIKSSQNQFDLTVEGILKLKNEGVSEEIIKAMIMGTGKKQISGQEADDAAYQKALGLLRGKNYDEAVAILSGLASGNSDTRYSFSHVEALLEKSMDMKESGDINWKSVAREAQVKIKNLYRSNYSNPDYLFLYAGFSALVDKLNDAEGAVKKALYYKPDYAVSSIAQANVYFYIAKNMSADSTRADMGKTAMKAYESLLDLPGMTDKERSEIYFKLAELTLYVFTDIPEAVGLYKKSVSAYPDAKWTATARERLAAYSKYDK